MKRQVGDGEGRFLAVFGKDDGLGREREFFVDILDRQLMGFPSPIVLVSEGQIGLEFWGKGVEVAVEVGGEFAVARVDGVHDGPIPDGVEILGGIDGRVDVLAVTSQIRVRNGVKRLVDIADEMDQVA